MHFARVVFFQSGSKEIKLMNFPALPKDFQTGLHQEQLRLSKHDKAILVMKEPDWSLLSETNLSGSVNPFYWVPLCFLGTSLKFQPFWS